MKDILTRSMFVLIVIVSSLSARNLLVNPDAETGTDSGWTDPNGQWDASAEVTPHGGAYFFWPKHGPVDNTYMYQDVPVTIGSDSLYFHLSGWLCDWDQYPHDRATLAIKALDVTGAELAYFQSEQRNPVWIKHVINAPIPAGTKKLRVLLIATRFVGTDNDAYFDDLSLTVDTNKSPTIIISAVGNAKMVATGATLKLTAVTTGAVDSSYDWSSSFPSVATIDSTGRVSGVASGHVFLQATGRQSGVVGIYELSVTQLDDILFTAPVNSTVFQAGKISTITWQVIGTVTTGELWLSRDGGVNFTSIAGNITCSNGTYAWNIPTDSVDQRQCVIKMSWVGGSSISGTFSILNTQLTNTHKELPGRKESSINATTDKPSSLANRQYLLDGRMLKTNGAVFTMQCSAGAKLLSSQRQQKCMAVK